MKSFLQKKNTENPEKLRFLVEITFHFARKQHYARIFLRNFEQTSSDLPENSQGGQVSVIKII